MYYFVVLQLEMEDRGLEFRPVSGGGYIQRHRITMRVIVPGGRVTSEELVQVFGQAERGCGVHMEMPGCSRCF
jgi:hypothetical protein